MLWVQLIICVLIIVLAGRKVAHMGDIIAVKTGFGGLWIGLVLLSITTSLPELFNGVSAIFIVNQPDLTIGNLLGACTFNLLNLAVLDIIFSRRSILEKACSSQKLSGWFSLVLVAIVGLSIWLLPRWEFTLGWIGWTTPIIVLLYFLFVRHIACVEKNNQPAENNNGGYQSVSLKKTLITFFICAGLIVGAGIWLATLGDQIADATGMGTSFIGSLLIGLITTLPEMTVSFSALRIGAVDMAVSNMVGSNMFNMLLICLDDLLYTRGSVLTAVSPNNLMTAILGTALILVTLAGLYFTPRHFKRVSWYNLLVIGLFLAGAYFNFTLSR